MEFLRDLHRNDYFGEKLRDLAVSREVRYELWGL